MKKIILIAVLGILILGTTAYFMTRGNSEINKVEHKQLYTCGMHPDIISDKPGNCPICGMKLIPVKNSSLTQSAKDRKILYWRAPMDPNEIYNHPGKSKMGMDLVPVYEDGAGGSGIVTIDPAVEQNMNVQTYMVASRQLSSTVITNGVLKIEEPSEYIVTTRVNGWIQKLYIDYTGKKVFKGEKLMDIYSPELVSAQQELLTAISYQSSVNKTNLTDVLASGNELVKNAVRKLQLLDVPDADIKKIEQTREVSTYMTLYAQSSGTVINKNIIEGQKINAGAPLLEIADLSNLWLTADIYEYELEKVAVGSQADIKFNYLPGKIYKGKISFIYPTLDPKSRTVKVRIDIPNSSGELKPDMFANVEIKGKNLGITPVVPENAVIRSGTKDLVIISLGDGKFKPQYVELGGYSGGYYQVLKGLNEGNVIVTSAQFLIDSESNLKAAINQFRESSPAPQNESGNKTDNETTKDMNKDSGKEDLSLVRKGIIDLQAIDKNKDGKVFEDMMDWNVISDSPGRCPLCNMKLVEVTLKQAKENLVKHGYKVK